MDPHEVLGLGAVFTAAELKARHRELVRRHHPDQFAQGSPEAAAAQERIADINLAYRLLSRPEEMVTYKRFLRRRKAATGMAAPRPEVDSEVPAPGESVEDFNYRAAASAEFWGVAPTNRESEFWTASGRSGRKTLDEEPGAPRPAGRLRRRRNR